MLNSFQSKKKILVAAGLLALLGVPLVLGYVLFRFHVRALDLQEAEYLSREYEYKKNLFNTILKEKVSEKTFVAQAIGIYDLNDQKYLYQKNTDLIVGIASLTKIMTAVSALELYPPTALVKISHAAILQTGEEFFFENQEWGVVNLVKSMLVASSNDAAYALVEGIPNFLEYMNTKAMTLGMTGTYFINGTGLDSDVGALSTSTMSSVDDLIKLMKYVHAAHPDIIYGNLAQPEQIVTDAQNNQYTATHTHIGIENFDHILFSKTGYTANAGGSLLSVVQYPGQPALVVVILGSTFNERFTDMNAILEIINSVYTLLDNQESYLSAS